MRRGGTILVVDDSPADRELIELCLRALGVQSPVHVLNDGAEAIAYLQGVGPFGDRDTYAYPALILTDLKMPRVDGLAVLEFLRSHPELAVIPTVVLSGSADPGDVQIAYRLGASSYIVKPTTTDDLRARLGLLIDYWSMCEAPLATRTGAHVSSDPRGKIGERYSRPPFAPPSGSSDPSL
jgi:CheY-like chemotaxis protein